jgi:hypothetical protein
MYYSHVDMNKLSCACASQLVKNYTFIFRVLVKGLISFTYDYDIQINLVQ